MGHKKVSQPLVINYGCEAGSGSDLDGFVWNLVSKSILAFEHRHPPPTTTHNPLLTNTNTTRHPPPITHHPPRITHPPWATNSKSATLGTGSMRTGEFMTARRWWIMREGCTNQWIMLRVINLAWGPISSSSGGHRSASGPPTELDHAAAGNFDWCHSRFQQSRRILIWHGFPERPFSEPQNH